ncbi:hypothetical protein PoB_000681300 [Plakobranchus ocellatus]|uniref:Uncharacterized protein n=1 Tax=Plakobranchus ocellatus TaxID=259542 RepID=A0AAV3YCZ0_9GAST|nr:hypothetical protein PoB_000681300 [Plakobranchus ocellatus]
MVERESVCGKLRVRQEETKKRLRKKIEEAGCEGGGSKGSAGRFRLGASRLDHHFIVTTASYVRLPVTGDDDEQGFP